MNTRCHQSNDAQKINKQEELQYQYTTIVYYSEKRVDIFNNKTMPQCSYNFEFALFENKCM